MTYFTNVNTLDELRSQYKTLLKRFHPDQPDGSEDATKAINAEYERLFKVLKDVHNSKAAGTDSSKSAYENMKYDFAEDQKLRDIIQKIISFEGITIEICGSWVWVSGNTYHYKKEFKNYGFKWASQKKQWYWHSETFVKKSRKSLSMEAIRNYYGSTEVTTEFRPCLEV